LLFVAAGPTEVDALASAAGAPRPAVEAALAELQRVAASVTAPGAAGAHANVAPFAAAQAAAPGQAVTLAEAMAELERRMISEALRKHSGNISRAARELGLTRRGLYLKLERHSLKIASA
jgi:DNA-binding NtrC family response regulator